VSTLLEARGLSVGYDGASVVRDLDLEVREGEVVALLGPNGAGKTTTMLALVGELRPIAGEIAFLGGRRASPLYRRARQGLGFVTEERSVFMSLTVRQNLGVGRCSQRHAIELFPELEPLLSRRAGLLSGGEQQMLTLARALARQPRLLLADELSLGLAPRAVDRLLTAVRIAADRGMGALLVEQHIHRALEVADRIYVLSGGRVEYAGSAEQARGRIDEIEGHYLGDHKRNLSRPSSIGDGETEEER
jgi:branched-chain amino acid transport system ATP-binding protein